MMRARPIACTWGALIAGGFLGLLLFSPGPAAAAGYEVYDLGTLGGPANQAYGINDLGQVVGQSSLDAVPGGDAHGFEWDNRALTDLGTLGGSNSAGNDLNESGQITGHSRTADGGQHAFLWQNGVMTDLSADHPTTPAAGWRVNNSGRVCGHLGTAAVMWENGSMTDLGSLGGSPRRAYGINEAGQIVGEAAIGYTHAFFWEDDGDPLTNDMRDLGLLPAGKHSQARAINNVGQVAGWAHYGSLDLEDAHAALWDRLSWDAAGNYTGDILDLGGLPGGSRSFAYGINDSAQVVGHAMVAGAGVPHAF